LRRLAIVSDTHVPDFARALPAWLLRLAERSDLIVHAGDVTAAGVLDELAALAPVTVALGNLDRDEVAAWGAAPVARVAVEGLAIAVVHDAGRRDGRGPRLVRRFPDADVVVFGHSHQPELRREGGVWLVNPGSPTWKRREPVATAVSATVDGRSFEATLVAGDA
jgi:putative phosphoesterase